jgi:pimeloyl-ACP methyl ester carboxylesterase
VIAIPGRTHEAVVPLLANRSEVTLVDHEVLPGSAHASHPAAGDLLLVHGFGGSKKQLGPLAGRLCPAGCTALLPTLRGHEGSPEPSWGYSPLDFTADLHRIGDVLGDAVHAVGYSYGALVATLSAVTWGAGRIRSLVVIDQSFAAHPDRFVDDEWAEGSHLRWNYDFSHLPALLRAQGVPLLVLAARESDVIGQEERDRLWAARDGLLECAEIPGTHATCIEHPDEIAATVADFHRRCTGGSAQEDA